MALRPLNVMALCAGVGGLDLGAAAALYFAFSAANWRGLARARGDELAKLAVQYQARGRRVKLLEAQVAATEAQRAGALAKADTANRARAEAKRAASTPA